jgi:putative transposase
MQPRAASHRTGRLFDRGCAVRAAPERMKRIERVKLYPTPSQQARLHACLGVCRELYNAALQQRRDAWRSRHLRIDHKRQYAELTELRKSDPRVASVYRELQDAALHKLDLAFRAFFARCKKGEAPGYPRFRSARRYHALEFPHGNRALKFNAAQTKVKVPGMGSVRLRRGRSVPVFGRAMLVRFPRGWYALFECERATTQLPVTGNVVGIDVGVAAFYATSNGHIEPKLRLGKQKAAHVARLQRIVAKRLRRGSRRRKAVRALARAQDQVRWARRDWHHKTARKVVTAYDAIAFEKLTVRSMTRSAKGSIEAPGTNVRQKSGLNRAILDAGWSQFTKMVVDKAEEAGRRVVFVDAKHTSQTCSWCGHIDAANRCSQASFACVSCGYALHADVNAAVNILKRAKLSPAGRGAALVDPVDPRSTLPPESTRLTQHDAARGRIQRKS